MIPKKIRSYFRTACQKTEGNNTLIKGILTCCSSHEFEVRVAGDIKCGLFAEMYLLPIDDKIVLEVCCKKCGKVISVFDSDHDGYGHCETKCDKKISTKPFVCKNCADNTFSVELKYEYPDLQELADLGITEMDNVFTWIWIALVCNKCGKKHRNFLNYETA